MAIAALGNYSNAQSIDSTTKSRQAPSSSTLSMDNFMSLLAVQLQNQDMNSPMSNSEMMQQLTSMATVQSMNTFTELSSTQYALTLMGQDVKVAKANIDTGVMEMKTGKVAGVNLSTMSIYLENDKYGYGLGNIMEVGKVPEEDKGNTGTGGAGGNTGTGGAGGNTGAGSTGGATGPDGTGGAGNNQNNTKGGGPGENLNSRAASLSAPGNEKSSSAYVDPAAINMDNLPEDKREALAQQNQIPEDKRAYLEAKARRNDGLEKQEPIESVSAQPADAKAGTQAGPGVHSVTEKESAVNTTPASKKSVQRSDERPALDPRRV